MKTPCERCGDRHPRCHGECDLYQDFVKRLEQIRKRRQEIQKLHAPSEPLERQIQRKLRNKKG